MQRKYRLKFNKKSKEKEPISIKKVITSILVIFFAFFGSFIIYFVLQVSLNSETPMVVVVSGSMEPNINKGDLLFIKGTDPEDIKECEGGKLNGDVIVFDAHGLWSGAPDDLIVHRVINIFEEDGKLYFVTKGDANSDKDNAPVPEFRVKGVVCGRVPYVGWVKIVLSDFGLLIPILVILAVPLFISILYDVYKGEEEEKVKEKIDKVEKLQDDKTTNGEERYLEKVEKVEKKDDDFDF